MRTSRDGFTLVEILTVIAIIVILGAILLPVLGRAREQSNRTHCMSSLHQIATALKLYKLDERGYPWGLNETGATQRPWISGERWYGSGTDSDGTGGVDTPDKRNPGYGIATLYPQYVESMRVLNCPNNDTDTFRGNAASAPDPPKDVGEANALKVSPYNSYDGYDKMLGEDRYCRSWTNVTTQPYYIRQLRWRYPPEDTVVTWCTSHRRITDPTDAEYGQQIGANRGDEDIVLYLDGTTKVVKTALSWAEPMELGSGHRSVPGEQE